MKEFICGTHYFGRGSPINMWSSIIKGDLDADIKDIKSKGFNTIVLLIPWSGFHKSLQDRSLDDYYVSLLKSIDSVCASEKLDIVFRIGYLWDSTPCDQPTYHRYSSLTYSREIFEEWLWFLNAFYELCKGLSCHKFSFISWEDFYWPIYRHYENVKNKNDVARYLCCSGLGSVLQRYKSYSKYFKGISDDLDVGKIPSQDEVWHSVYTNHFDNVIWREILDLSCLAFPGLSVELRVDPEWEKTNSKIPGFHNWSQNHINSSIPIIYYHANIATKADSVMDARQANHHLAQLLDRYSPMKRLGQQKPFVDQFNFYDDTYKEWGKIDADEYDYVDRVFSTLKKLSSGYAIWGYRDWKKNIVHNPFFEMGLNGWRISEGVREAVGGAHIENGDLYQEISHLALDEGERSVLIKGTAEKNCQVIIHVFNEAAGTSTFNTESSGCFEIEQILPEIGRVTGVKISIEGVALLTHVEVVGRSFSQGFADKSGNLSKIGEFLVDKQLGLASANND